MPDGFMRLSLNANAFIGLGSLALRFSAVGMFLGLL